MFHSVSKFGVKGLLGAFSEVFEVCIWFWKKVGAHLCVPATCLQQPHWLQGITAILLDHLFDMDLAFVVKSVSLKFAPIHVSLIFPCYAYRILSIVSCRWAHMESFNHMSSFPNLCQPALVFCLYLGSIFWKFPFLPTISVSQNFGNESHSSPAFGRGHPSGWCSVSQQFVALSFTVYRAPFQVSVTLGKMLWDWVRALTLLRSQSWGSRALGLFHPWRSTHGLAQFVGKKKNKPDYQPFQRVSLVVSGKGRRRTLVFNPEPQGLSSVPNCATLYQFLPWKCPRNWDGIHQIVATSRTQERNCCKSLGRLLHQSSVGESLGPKVKPLC